MKNLFRSFSNKNLVLVLFFAIVSGAPLGVIINVIQNWFQDKGVALSVITGLLIFKMFYTLKPVWAPIIDVYKIPFIKGRRQGWMILSSAIMASFTLWMSFLNPNSDIICFRFAIAGFIFFSATYDIAWDACRIEMLDEELQSEALANNSVGFRIGMLISVLSFWASEKISWNIIMFGYSAFFILSAMLILLFNEPKSVEVKPKIKNLYLSLWESVKNVLNMPLVYLIIPAILFYKAGDAMLGAVSTLFFRSVGYSKTDIVHIVKIYGMIASLLGGYGGSYVISMLGNAKALIICGVLQSLTNLTYNWVFYASKTKINLLIAICSENFTGAMGAVALVTYLTSFCNKNSFNTGTNFSLLVAFAILPNSTLTSMSGTIVEYLGWNNYFIFTVIISIPSLLLFGYIANITRKNINNSV